ncbi:MAG: PAS domain-containing protein, partial [Gammaproteobacteria bacterium]|nr:PAS domain-containing protein [Gammaproteobacteria bacterium]
MKSAPIPDHEFDRLAELYRFKVLDTGVEEEFEEFTRLAAQICGTPIALVSLIDADRQWFKSRYGLDVSETPRDISFCGHAIHGEEVFEVSNALEDWRFADNPLVTQAPDIRFYAGAPLLTPKGHAIGTLCVIDRQPHHLTEEQKTALTILSRQVVRQLERRLDRDRERELYQEIARQAKFQKVLLDSAMAGVISTTADGLISSLNPAAERMLGYRAAELVGKQGVSVLHVRQELEARAEALSAELGRRVSARESIVAKVLLGHSDSREWHYRCKDGSLLPVILSVSAMRDDEGTLSGFVALVWDVSQRKKADAALNRSEVRLNLAMSAGRTSLWDMEIQEKRITFDASWSRLLGEEPVEITITDEQMAAKVPPDDWLAVRANLREAITGRTPNYLAEHRVQHRLGHWLWIESRGQVVERDADGRAVRMIGTNTDITARKETDLAFRRSEARLQLAMSATRTSLWESNPATGQITLDVHWNELIGAEPKETNMSFPELVSIVPPDEMPHVLARMMAVIKGHETDYVSEHRVRHRLGHYIWIESRGKVVERDFSGKATRMIGTNTDITERKRLDAMKGEFVSTVSHELRTPLTSISGALGLVCGGALGPVTEQTQAMLDIAYKNSQRLTHLINDLLDMEKLVAGKMRFELQTQEVMPLVEQAVESMRSYAQQHQVELVIRQRADGAKVRVDASRLQQVLSNFLSNAAKFSPVGGTVEISVRGERDVVRVEVQDRGPGIPAEFRKRIFQKFSQADSSDTRQKGGTGLGLAISKELIERM